ncbi:hypothetical protein Ancab_007039 [Ancistrocladus abbreviatus]
MFAANVVFTCSSHVHVPADNSAICNGHREQILLPPVRDELSILRSSWPPPFSSSQLSSPSPSTSLSNAIRAIHEDKQQVSILVPNWEVLVITSPAAFNYSGDNCTCVFRNNAIAPARFSGELPFTKQITFKCEFPANVRRRLPFLQPVLIKSDSQLLKISPATAPELLKWNFLVYESFSSENDVVLFAKGVNNHQGINRPASELTCLFINAATVMRTSVKTSMQEVFRCAHPDLSSLQPLIRASLEIKSDENGTSTAAAVQLPSVAYYHPQQRTVAESNRKLICACTMVYNVAKFLKEWVMFHSKIGVEKFILYDNESNDNLQKVVDELAGEGYNVETLFWIWPKAQEAGFSHCAVHAQQTCTWMMYIDVDEFIFSPSWLNSDSPSPHMLKSLLPKHPPLPPKEVVEAANDPPHAAAVGQVSIKCHEFGPSNRSVHPIEGVTQGYTWRRRFEQRHKSIVLLEAVDQSLTNAIHHFELKKGYRTRTLGIESAVVNHYKYQAWPEFKAKFRRRVSAYVVDWRQNVNLLSKDRTPGLGSEAVEPIDWVQKFCEVRDERLQNLTRRWFGVETEDGNIVVAWQQQR